jgi:hypothetical protein
MFANRFAADHYNCSNPNDTVFIQANDSSPRPIRGSRRLKHPDSPRDFLANRVSFYMDDIPSSNDEVVGSVLDLRYQQSTKRLYHSRNLMTRSFRAGERKPVRLARHSSDVCPTTKRSTSTSGSRRQPRRRDSYGGSMDRSDSRAVVRSVSYRSNGNDNGKMRRQDSSNSKRSSTRRESDHIHRKSSFKVPHKELHRKERRRRIVVLMVVSTFMFLVACSVLAVVVTLTHSSFHRSSYHLPDKAEHLYPRVNFTATGKVSQPFVIRQECGCTEVA